ncbi:hypothetical protein CIPAW_10G090000 [Carya illinoinensis]|uniref:Uncharacterized protein n=1 Tax=Carya illinoinensis TaxID=32201 RepID=A0A8T1PAZ5_CARIL|nr:hypothetical protein CIPAW_10G090000 [Carya illinoinensis]
MSDSPEQRLNNSNPKQRFPEPDSAPSYCHVEQTALINFGGRKESWDCKATKIFASFLLKRYTLLQYSFSALTHGLANTQANTCRGVADARDKETRKRSNMETTN